MTDFPDLKIKALLSFPATVQADAGVGVVKSNGTYNFNLAFDHFGPPVDGVDPVDQNVLVWNDVTGQYTLVPLSILGVDPGISEAPDDLVQYGRQSLGWTPINTNTIPEAPNDGSQYARESLGWTAIVPNPVVDTSQFGAAGDAIETTRTASITSGLKVLTVTVGLFAASDVGKRISIAGAGASGATLQTVITARTSATQVTLFNAAGTTLAAVANTTILYGTDDTAALQAAFAAVCATVNKSRLEFAPGSYIATAELLVDRSDVTIDMTGARLYVEHNGNGVTCYHAGDPIRNISLVGFDIKSVYTRTTGAGVYLLNTVNLVVERPTIDRQDTGIYVSVYGYVYIQTPTIIHNRIAIRAYTGDALFVGGVGGRISQEALAAVSGTIGIYLERAGGTILSHLDVTTCGYGVYMVPNSGGYVVFTFLTNVLCDTCEIGFHADATNGDIYHIQIDHNCWFNTSVHYGMHLIGVQLAMIAGVTMLNRDYGILLEGCEEIDIRHMYCSYNNQANSSSGAGILMTNCTSVRVRDCTFNNVNSWYPLAFGPHQDYGVLVNTGNDQVHITDNTFKALNTADILFLATPTVATVQRNITDRSNVVASATNIAPSIIFDEIEISGTTLVQNIVTPPIKGKTLRVITQGACTIQNSFNFKLAGNFAGTADSTLTLRAGATHWCETARAIL